MPEIRQQRITFGGASKLGEASQTVSIAGNLVHELDMRTQSRNSDDVHRPFAHDLVSDAHVTVERITRFRQHKIRHLLSLARDIHNCRIRISFGQLPGATNGPLWVKPVGLTMRRVAISARLQSRLQSDRTTLRKDQSAAA